MEQNIPNPQPVTPPVQPIQSQQPVTSNNPQMAGFFERFVATFIDGIILFFAGLILSFIILVPILMLLAAIGMSGAISMNPVDILPVQVNDLPSTSTNYASNTRFNFEYSIFGAIVSFIYYGFSYTKWGRTVGQKAMNLRVIKTDTMQSLNWGETFIREIIGKWISGLLFFLGYLWYFMDEKRQTWHDKLAHTYVVKTDINGAPLMNGPQSYPKEPLKTFAPCGCLVLIFGLVIAFIISLISMAMNAPKDIPAEIAPIEIPREVPNNINSI